MAEKKPSTIPIPPIPSAQAATSAPKSPTSPDAATADASKKAVKLQETEIFASVLIKDVPHHKQKPDFCGEACTSMYLQKLGFQVTQDDVFDHFSIDPALGRGAVTAEMAKGLAAIGFEVGPVWHTIQPKTAPSQMQALWKTIHTDLAAGIPSVVCMHYDTSPKTTEHFRLLLGYDSKTDEILYHEPAEDAGAYRKMKRSLFFQLWPLKYKPESWLLIRLRLQPAKIQITPSQGGHTKAAFAQHVMALKPTVPAGFHLVIEPPFVVLGDDPAARVQAYAKGTVRWAVEKLKALYFQKDPTSILNVWLFRDRASYQKYNKLLFDETPDTPYGYYSSTHKALVMNIATGGGTLVHEIVHPFMEANFPQTPDWFNEGLGSLYEQSSEKGGRIVGLTNWRLEGLQDAIAKKKLPPFEAMLKTTRSAFYNRDPGTNYAQARYLCYYLQEKGLLVDFYKAFVKQHKSDPSGIKTLQAILKVKDLVAFQKGWEEWVSQLTFP